MVYCREVWARKQAARAVQPLQLEVSQGMRAPGTAGRETIPSAKCPCRAAPPARRGGIVVAKGMRRDAHALPQGGSSDAIFPSSIHPTYTPSMG